MLYDTDYDMLLKRVTLWLDTIDEIIMMIMMHQWLWSYDNGYDTSIFIRIWYDYIDDNDFIWFI